MAICNLFNRLTSVSGNFMMFSQYVEDITNTYVENDNYKVVPTKFIALDIDYKNIKYKENGVIPNSDDSLNIGIPKYFQNYFENGCAYGRKNINNWTPEISKNLFWNAMIDGGFITTKTIEDINYAKEIVYVGDINMHSHNTHKGMGYGEIYCYVPTDAKKTNVQLVNNFSIDRNYNNENTNSYLEGYGPTEYVSFSDKISTISIENYSKKYYYNKDYSLAFDDIDLQISYDNTIAKYNINTFVPLYGIFRKIIKSDNSILWEPIYENIPLGLYITGMFDENNDLTNNISKYVTTSYGIGTSYGLRICTRFSVSTSGAILNNSDIVVDNSNYTNLSQLMTAMGENLHKMLDVCKNVQDTTNEYKELLSVFKNHKANVPYIREINGKSYWFVNGRLVSIVSDLSGNCCNFVSPEIVQKRIDNIMDNDNENDFDYIEDPNSNCECYPLSNKDLANHINEIDEEYNFEYDGPDYGGGTTGGTTPPKPGGECSCDLEVAEDLEVIAELEKKIEIK